MKPPDPSGAPQAPPAREPEALLPLRLEKALAARQALFDPEHRSAFRLFNGFSEGWPGLAADLYGSTLVLHDHAGDPPGERTPAAAALALLRERLPWLRAALHKSREAAGEDERRGRLLFGRPDDRVREYGIWYALDLCLHQDASLYLDARLLRQWVTRSLRGRTLLNTFAYTGSLGVAALAGGASRVVQLDLDRRFLNLAKTSYTLNGFPIQKGDFLQGEFFTHVAALKRAGEQFDCVLLDPPFFSSTARSALDLNRDSARLINKVRPLVRDGGLLVAVNNALYVSGRDYLATLEELCADGYLKIAELLPVGDDFTGYVSTRQGSPVTDPAPFNHSTKIAVLEVRRKKGVLE